MRGGYLAALDALLARGTRGLGSGFVARQVAFVTARQQPDGGFPGRWGPSDPYYTDFAIRVLALLAPTHPALARAAAYLEDLEDTPAGVVECFSRLNAARLLRGCGIAVSAPVPGARECALAALETRPPGAYEAFLAALCLEMVETPRGRGTLPARIIRALWPGAGGGPVARAARVVAEGQAPEGGFAARPGDGEAQTNATAAAVALLLIGRCQRRGAARAAARFLASLQAPDGGLRALAAAVGGDLLSTFTGLLTLHGLGAARAVDLTAVARFVRSAACATGGFAASAVESEPDLEYTYYGLGTMALLRVLAEGQRRPPGR